MHLVDDKLLLYSVVKLQCCCHPNQVVICMFNSRVHLSPPPFSSSSYTNKQEDRSRHAEVTRLRWSLWHSLRRLHSDAWFGDLIGWAGGLCDSVIEESLGCVTCVVHERTMTGGPSCSKFSLNLPWTSPDCCVFPLVCFSDVYKLYLKLLWLCLTTLGLLGGRPVLILASHVVNFSEFHSRKGN